MSCITTKFYSYLLDVVAAVVHIQEFAEKPKGEALQKMRVDTTKLGESSWRA